MAYAKSLFVVAAAAALFGCGSGDKSRDAAPVAVAETPVADDAATLCLFEAADTKDWAGAPNDDQDVEVSGKVHLADEAYTATLDRPETNGEVARLWLSMAENSGGTVPADGWHEVAATIEDSGEVRTVEIWCDEDTRLASIPVRRG